MLLQQTKNQEKLAEKIMNSNNPNIITLGTWINIQDNRRRFKIVCVAAWSSEDLQTPSHYDVVDASGHPYRMIPAERISLSSSFRDPGSTSLGQAIQFSKQNLGVKKTHCWSCKSHISSEKNDLCLKCRGLICSCGACLCNKPNF